MKFLRNSEKKLILSILVKKKYQKKKLVGKCITKLWPKDFRKKIAKNGEKKQQRKFKQILR